MSKREQNNIHVYEYLLFNCIVIAGPLLALFFYPYVKQPSYPSVAASIFCVLLLFGIWDHYVTGLFWRFNSKYIMGIRIGRLPIEELLFFITVPFACLFLWIHISLNVQTLFSVPVTIILFFLISFVCMGIFFFIKKRLYTAQVFFLSAITIGIDLVLKTNILTNGRDILFLGLILILTGICNTYLTARPVVIYYNTHKTNILIGTVPIEDFLYGLSLVLLTIIFYNACNTLVNF